MPYKRRAPRRRRKRPSVAKLVKNILAKQTEVKHRFITAATNFNNVGYGLCVHDFISPGVAVSERVGDRVNMLSLMMNSKMESSTRDGGTFRLLLVETRRPLEPITLTPTFYNIRPLFDNSVASVGPVAASLDFDWVKKVYVDKRYTFNQMRNADSNGDLPILSKFCKWYKGFGKQGRRIIYDQDTATPAVALSKTYIYCCFVADNDISVTPSIYLKIRYTDA